MASNFNIFNTNEPLNERDLNIYRHFMKNTNSNGDLSNASEMSSCTIDTSSSSSPGSQLLHWDTMWADVTKRTRSYNSESDYSLFSNATNNCESSPWDGIGSNNTAGSSDDNDYQPIGNARTRVWPAFLDGKSFNMVEIVCVIFFIQLDYFIKIFPIDCTNTDEDITPKDELRAMVIDPTLDTSVLMGMLLIEHNLKKGNAVKQSLALQSTGQANYLLSNVNDLDKNPFMRTKQRSVTGVKSFNSGAGRGATFCKFCRNNNEEDIYHEFKVCLHISLQTGKLLNSNYMAEIFKAFILFIVYGTLELTIIKVCI